MWGLGIQLTLILATLGFMWNHFDKRFQKIEDRLEKLENRMIKQEFDMIEVKTNLLMREFISTDSYC
jgi:hypothetical protein